MKKLFLITSLLFFGATSARADITSRMTSSVQLQVNAAATSMQRIGNSYSISGKMWTQLMERQQTR